MQHVLNAISPASHSAPTPRHLHFADNSVSFTQLPTPRVASTPLQPITQSVAPLDDELLEVVCTEPPAPSLTQPPLAKPRNDSWPPPPPSGPYYPPFSAVRQRPQQWLLPSKQPFPHLAEELSECLQDVNIQPDYVPPAPGNGASILSIPTPEYAMPFTLPRTTAVSSQHQASPHLQAQPQAARHFSH